MNDCNHSLCLKMRRTVVVATLLLVSECGGLAIGGPAKPNAAAQSTTVLPNSWWGPEAGLEDLEPNLSAQDSTAADILENVLWDECDLDQELEPSDACVPASMRTGPGEAPPHQPPCVEDDSCHQLIFEDELEKLDNVQVASPVPVTAPWLDPCWYDEECELPAA